MKNKALFLDRDGTLNYDVHHLHDPAELVVVKGAREALMRARELGYRFYLVTNQSGVGRGYFTMEDVYACNRRLLELLDLGDDLFDGVIIAPEHPDQPSEYRKPSPKFLLEMIARDKLDPATSYMLGDRDSDWQCGLNAGVNPVALNTGKEFPEPAQALITAHEIPVYDSIVEFVATLG
ncbi:D-glycero-alpha-D-manno-heptose-1,7-bisphosphate 7-phosphatase [Cerasicoccus arenae]|nr:HAD-IIIA family hydrolase [Cerasicoccus arenae]MBK1857926.1 HAD-IIIA family hydrolase [Cerasicoccus arenae]